MIVRDKYEQILQDYEKQHPHFYDMTVDWWASGRMSIGVKLENGNRYEYDQADSSLRRLRPEDDGYDDDVLEKEVCANIRKYIPITGKTHEELCEEVGISRQMLSRYIHGKSAPGPAKLYRIAKALGCTVNELYDESYME